MKKHCKWISQRMIISHNSNNDNNNNNNNNNNSNNNNNLPVVLKYQVSIRRGIAILDGQVGIFSIVW